MSELTRLLSTIENGDSSRAEEILPLVYSELRKLAARKLAHERDGQTLQATALVHEAYIRLVGSGSTPSFSGRGHFFAAAAEAMRRILIENARRRRRIRHGGGRRRLDLGMLDLADDEASESLLELDDALERLAAEERTAAEVVKLRFFAGLTSEEAAAVLGISLRTANRHWAYARAWLYRQLSAEDRTRH